MCCRHFGRRVTAALAAAGYTGPELEDIVLHQMDFTEFEDKTFLGHFGAGGKIVEFFRTSGMHSGNYFLGWIRELLAATGRQSSETSAAPERATRSGPTGSK